MSQWPASLLPSGVPWWQARASRFPPFSNLLARGIPHHLIPGLLTLGGGVTCSNRRSLPCCRSITMALCLTRERIQLTSAARCSFFALCFSVFLFVQLDRVAALDVGLSGGAAGLGAGVSAGVGSERSEEHTSELQSRQYLVCRLLLEK